MNQRMGVRNFFTFKIKKRNENQIGVGPINLGIVTEVLIPKCVGNQNFILMIGQNNPHLDLIISILSFI